MVAEDGAVRRLGKAELGRYAFEQRMPRWLEKHLQTKDVQKFTGLIPVLAHLCENDDDVQVAYFCHPVVSYISKTLIEGHYFCGYRNIQMLISYIKGARARGCDYFRIDGETPTVLELQDLIEEAWDSGISDGRVETGGVRLTRKHIGTPEAQSIFRFLKVPCRAGIHRPTASGVGAWESLLDAVEEYFRASDDSHGVRLATSHRKVVQTLFPPIYLQRLHHSLTIVGFERRVKKDLSQTRNLLVFDPAYQPSRGLKKLATRFQERNGSSDGINLSSGRPRSHLKPYRRGRRELGRYERFETLTLTSRLNNNQGGDVLEK